MLFLILMLSCALNRFNPGSKGIMEDIDKVIQSPSQENAEAVLSNLNSKYSYKVYEKLIDTGDTRFFNHIPKEFLRHGLLLKIRKNKNIELERMFLDRIKATELERLVVEGKADEINDKSKEWLIKNYKYREEAVGTAGILFIYEKEELVKKLLDKLKEERKDLGNQILLSASKVGNCGLIEHLLESNLANNINDGFLLAAENGHKDICELLIDKGADINVVNNKICESNSRDNQEMRESRASLNEKTDNNCEFVYKWYEGPTALGYAAKNGHRNVCELLLDRGADIDIRDIEGMTALIHAAENGHKEVCELLIDKGAGVNIKINKERIGEKATSLPWFAFLLPQRINSLCENKMGLTALIFAAKNGHKEVCELLIDRGAEVDAEFRKDVEQLCLTKGYLGNYSEDPKIEKKYQEWGITALIYAAQNGHLEVCKLLLDKGASVHAKVNKKGEDALCSKDSECPDNSEMEYGATALMYAAYKGRKEVCTLLLDRGAKVDMADEDGWTALMIVAWEGYKEICELLIERGADLKHISQTQIAVKLKLIKDNILHLDEESLEKGKSINLIRILEKKIVEGKNLREILEDTREKRKRQGLSDEWKDAVDELVNKIVANEGDNMEERVENERLEKMLIKNCLMKEVIKIKEESIIKNEKREHEKDSLRHVRKKLGCDESVDRSK